MSDAAGNAAVVKRRRVVVIKPCMGDEFMCEDGTCSVDGVCGGLVYEIVVEESEELASNQPPEIELLGPQKVHLRSARHLDAFSLFSLRT